VPLILNLHNGNDCSASSLSHFTTDTKKIKRLDGSQSKSGHPGREKIRCPVQDLLYRVKYNKDLTVFIPIHLNLGFLQGKSQPSTV